MEAIAQPVGTVVDERLAPPGLTRFLGRYAAHRRWVLVAAAALLACACAALVLVPLPPVTVGLVFIVPVAIIASELGTRAGLLTAALSIAMVLAWLASGVGEGGASTIIPRAAALVFLAWIIGRTSDRAERSRKLLHRVLEATTDSIYVKDLEGRYLLVNSATVELIGRPANEIIGHANDEVLPEVSVEIAARDAAVLDSLATSSYELSGRFGTRAYVLSVTKSPFCDASGNAIGSLGIARDITEQRELQERFRRAFEDAPIGMALADLEGSFLDVNQALCAITGYTHDELCGRLFTTITHPDDLEADYAVMQSLISGETGSSIDEKRYVRPDGSIVWVARGVTLVRAADGAPLHFLDQIQDITERRRFESELRHLADHDPLTGLYNRRRLEQELDRHVAEIARYGPRGALIILDLDYFKRVNDALGHKAGDELIVDVAELLRERLRVSDIIARLGGDEFAVLLPDGGGPEAELVAGDLVRAIGASVTVAGAEHEHGMTTSAGVAPFGDHATTGAEILVKADLAMYQAKEAGRNRVAVARPGAILTDRV
jgi:diguanylate cyclase (GGDEF)-like protein/PAS domain S-box-containing protein